jgi:hypothetical protein
VEQGTKNLGLGGRHHHVTHDGAADEDGAIEVRWSGRLGLGIVTEVKQSAGARACWRLREIGGIAVHLEKHVASSTILT